MVDETKKLSMLTPMEKGEVMCPVCGVTNGDEDATHFMCVLELAEWIKKYSEPKRISLEDYNRNWAEGQIARDAAKGIQTLVLNKEGRVVMVIGTGKLRKFAPTFDIEALLAECEEEDDD